MFPQCCEPPIRYDRPHKDARYFLKLGLKQKRNSVLSNSTSKIRYHHFSPKIFVLLKIGMRTRRNDFCTSRQPRTLPEGKKGYNITKVGEQTENVWELMSFLYLQWKNQRKCVLVFVFNWISSKRELFSSSGRGKRSFLPIRRHGSCGYRICLPKFLCPSSQLKNFEHSDFVAGGLSGHHDVALNFRPDTF